MLRALSFVTRSFPCPEHRQEPPPGICCCTRQDSWSAGLSVQPTMKKISAPRLLSLFAAASLICATVALLASGLIPIWAVVLIGFFHSIMFPTIFALSIKNLRFADQTWFVASGDGDHWRGVFPGNHGTHFRCLEHSKGVRHSAPVLPFYSLFWFVRIQARASGEHRDPFLPAMRRALA